MSVIVRVLLANGKHQVWVLSKGSPEKLGRLCSSQPPAYDRTSVFCLCDGRLCLLTVCLAIDQWLRAVIVCWPWRGVKCWAMKRVQLTKKVGFFAFVRWVLHSFIFF